jgi:hypothetical protein
MKKFLFFFLIQFACFGQFSPTKNVYISIIPKPVEPAHITIENISFSDFGNNDVNILNANEKGEIYFTLRNSGKGTAYQLTLSLKVLRNSSGLEIEESRIIGDLEAGEELSIVLPLFGSMDLGSGITLIQMKISEGNGFDPNPFEISFQTQAFKEPRPLIADHNFRSEAGVILSLGDIADLEVVIQNQGQGVAKDVKVDFSNPANIYPAGETHYEYSSLQPNESIKISYEFFSNRRYTGDEIPIDVSVSESYGKYGTNRTFTVPLNQRLEQIKSVSISGTIKEEVAIDQVYLTSEVDRDIPLVAKTNKHRYALIIGNEDYRKYQTRLQNDQNVAFARNDARTFKEYCQNTLGVQDDHIFIITDATKGMMSREIERVVKLAAMDSQTELIFYYAGHGLPDQVSREGYLIPVDVTSSNLEDAISLKELYSKLASTNASKIYVFLDACFSGGGRGENGLLAARTVKVKPKGDIVEGNIIAFTASSGEEVSLPLNSESHGLFTYFLLKKLKESKGEVSLGQLKNYLQEKVPRKSLIENGIGQTPQVLVSPDLSEEWANWRFQ